MAVQPGDINKITLANDHVTIAGQAEIGPSGTVPPPPPKFARFTMDSFGITNTRSLRKDTDYVYLSVTVGDKAPVMVQKSMGDVDNGNHSVGLSIDVDIPDDDTIVVFSYLIMNSGHGDDKSRTRAAQSALSTVSQEIIQHKAIAAGTIVVGAILVPLFVSALAAIAGVLGVVEVGLLLFADCDGLVAAGAIPFTCRDLIGRTTGARKLTYNTDHPGIDSADGCGANSHYTTLCNITTAESIQTVLDPTGAWAVGGVAGPFLSKAGNTISIDMSATHRPTATGHVVDSTHISVNFPDDKTYTGTLQEPNILRWSNNTTWTQVKAIQTVIDLNGRWMVGGVLGPIITVKGDGISINMSASNQPTAVGTVMNSTTISIMFSAGHTLSGVLQAPGTIRWSNNTVWTKFDISPIKHLFVLVMENRSFDHMLGFQRIVGKDAHTGAQTKAEDLTGPGGAAYSNQFGTLRYAVSPTAGDTTYQTHDVKHQFLDVLTQLCGQAEGEAVRTAGGLKGAAYPPVADANARGFAADYALNSDSANPGEPMRCFAYGAAPVLTALATEFVLCDHWFSAMAGPTEPNRMFVHAATSGGWDDSPSNTDYVEIFGAKAFGDSDDGIKFEHGTIFDRLRQAKVPFRIYAGDHFPQVGLLSGISLSDDVDDFADFAGDVDNPNYDAAYTFIEPRYDTIADHSGLSFVNNSQHPPNSAALGEALIKNVYETIRNSPHWGRSMLIVTWDEHGGFFDHVTPPPAARLQTGSPPKDVQGKSYGYMFDRYGPRVPAVIISPLCPKNLIEHRQLEHSVIPATVEQLFGLSPMTNRDAGVAGLHTLATLATPRNVTTPIPDAHPATEPTTPVPAAPLVRTGLQVTPGTKIAAPAAPAPAAAATAKPVDPATPLNRDDPWLASALAVAVKAHIAAVPTDAEAIKARVFGLKTVGDLAQYHNDVVPILTAARAKSRAAKVGARKVIGVAEATLATP
jgi:phospholipase C